MAYLNGQIRIGFIRGNEILEKSDGIPLDGKILTGICVVANGDTVREAARKSVSKYSGTSIIRRNKSAEINRKFNIIIFSL